MAAHPEDFSDFTEMSGLYASFIVTYGQENGLLTVSRNAVFPMLRVFPNNTHGSFRVDVDAGAVPVLLVGGRPLREKPVRFRFDGTVVCESVDGHLTVTRVLFPCTDRQAVCEIFTVRNGGEVSVPLSCPALGTVRLQTVTGPKGVILAERTASLTVAGAASDGTAALLAPGAEAVLSVFYTGRTGLSPNPAAGTDASAEYAKRMKRIDELTSPMALDTGCAEFDTLFRFAKLRCGESIFRTANGDVLSPGGGAYYAAVWCNDEVEYAGPWEAYTGDPIQLDAGYNAYAWYYPFMADYDRPIPSSIVAEGTNFWNGAGDRGDAAMYLYGASRYALTCGRMGPDRVLWQAIRWCAGYCLSRRTEDGVIASDSDELEGRLPSGKCNLSTNMLTLGGLRYAARIADALGDADTGRQYRTAADELEAACEAYFAASVHGFDTYRYYEGNTTLRSWICLPLCMGIETHADGTAAAITSPYLMSEAGQLSEEGTSIAWDRSTLYGMRGMFRAGRTQAAWDYLRGYCGERLLGRHIPYPVEAWPEGGMRHLAAESALFCQIVTEGLLAIEPLSFSSFSLHPRLPDGMEHLTLSGIHAFGEVFTIDVRDGGWTVQTQSGKRFCGMSDARRAVQF